MSYITAIDMEFKAFVLRQVISKYRQWLGMAITALATKSETTERFVLKIKVSLVNVLIFQVSDVMKLISSLISCTLLFVQYIHILVRGRVTLNE